MFTKREAALYFQYVFFLSECSILLTEFCWYIVKIITTVMSKYQLCHRYRLHSNFSLIGKFTHSIHHIHRYRTGFSSCVYFRILDLLYANLMESDSSSVLHKLGISHHNLIRLVPAYKPIARQQSATKMSLKVFSKDAEEALQACFSVTNCCSWRGTGRSFELCRRNSRER